MGGTIRSRDEATPKQVALWEEMDRCPVACNCDSVCVAAGMVRAERERCAEIAESIHSVPGKIVSCACDSRIAQLIRNQD